MGLRDKRTWSEYEKNEFVMTLISSGCLLHRVMMMAWLGPVIDFNI